jgi:cobyrinic acid a,c-diamide synthase
MSVPRLVIAGASSGVGKTTLAVGLMAAYRRRGRRVAPFKVGPDYLDPGWHTAACGRPSAPLDTWMLGVEGVRRSFQRGVEDADLALIEGMMGLHDGAEASTDRGSTAEVAKVLEAPVVLVLDGSALARSAGAVALGYRLFDPDVRFAGVIANRLAGAGHAEYLRPGIETRAELPLLGWLPSAPGAQIPERYLGLGAAGEQRPDLVERLADLIEAHLDLDALLHAAQAAPPLPLLTDPPTPTRPGVRLGIAQDAAFSFYYPDNLALLQRAGAVLVPFSPISDTRLPERLDGLYLGGGYPELHAAALAKNGSLHAEIRAAARRGLPIYAECGGLMYLCAALRDARGREHPLVGLVPARCVMEPGLQAIGYREVVTRCPTLLGPPGTTVRGHEFHHSRLEGDLPAEALAFRVGERSIGFATGNLLASYVHLHFGSNPAAAEHFINQCLATR